MRLANLDVTFHRTVRVAEGRQASNLPPSLGHMRLYKVSDYRKNCPSEWDDEAYFAALHDHEAMWISFRSYDGPLAVLVGAGGVNALTGQKLGTKLEKDNYVVCPPQPWLDGWKDVDGTVHQFVATPHKKGEGITVGEQLIGKDSKTGAIGLAIFQPKVEHKGKLQPQGYNEVYGGSAYGETSKLSGNISWLANPIKSTSLCMSLPSENETEISCNVTTTSTTSTTTPTKYSLMKSSDVLRSAVRSPKAVSHVEMGLGKGGKIIQKVYSDPHGLEVWEEKPSVVFAFYLVDAKTAAAITGETVNTPATSISYTGPWFGLQDAGAKAVLGTSAFAGLKSAAFVGDTENVKAETETENEKQQGDKKAKATGKAAKAKVSKR